MGFCFRDTPLARVTARGADPGVARGTESAAVVASRHSSRKKLNTNSGERGCDACPLQESWGRIASPRMPLSGNSEGDILLIGEAPGEEEDIQGQVFVGKTGKFLRRHLPLRIHDRLAFTNAARCRPPGNRTPTGAELYCCSVHLEDEITRGNYKAVILVGNVPLSRFIAEAPITHIHGLRFPIEIAGKSLWAFPIFHPSYVERLGGEKSSPYPCFVNDIKRFFKQVDKWEKPVIERISSDDVIIVDNEQQARNYISKMQGVLGFDIETSKLKPWMHNAHIISAAFSDGRTTIAFPVEHPAITNKWALPLILEVTDSTPWVGHQSQFEYTWCRAMATREGIDWRGNEFDDSMALGRLYHCRESLLGLDILSRIILGVNIKKLTNVSARHIMDYSLDEILPYNGLDAWASRRILDKLSGKVNKDNYNRILRVSRSVAQMELLGLDIDKDWAQQLKDKWQSRAIELQNSVNNIYEVKEFVRERLKEFRISSPDDVGQALTKYGRVELPKSPSGKLSTDDSVLRPIAKTNPLASAVLDYRESVKHVSTYIDLVLAIDNYSVDGRLHPSYTTMRVSTLRLSSENPNIQNWPKRRHREIRGMVRARPGHVLVACDSGQIQARLYGMATRDRNLCDSFIDKEDIHTYWLNRALSLYPDYLSRLAHQTNQVDDDKIIKAGRDIIKSDFTFASFFGTSAKNCAERTGIPFIIVQQLLDEFWGRYAEAHRWLQGRRAEYRDTGGVTTLTGQRRYGVMSGNEPIITPIQAGEAELMLGAQCELSELAISTGDMYLHPRINVHDDLTFELPDNDDRIEEYIQGAIAPAMVRVRYRWQIVPLTVEVKIGYRWDDLEVISVIEGDYVK